MYSTVQYSTGVDCKVDRKSSTQPDHHIEINGVFPKRFTECSEFSDKNIVITVKGLEPATSCVRDQHATTAPARHMLKTGSLN